MHLKWFLHFFPFKINIILFCIDFAENPEYSSLRHSRFWLVTLFLLLPNNLAFQSFDFERTEKKGYSRNMVGWFVVFNVTLNNISSWRIVLLVEEIGVSRWKPVASHWQTLSYNVVSSTPGHECVSQKHVMHTYIVQ